MGASSDFKLFRCLAADLRWARTVVHGKGATISTARLWLGLFSPRFLPVFLCRLAHFFHLKKLGPIAKLVSLLNFFFFGIEIAVRCPIGEGLFLPHTQGTVIGAYAIGRNAIIFQGVTLGAKELDFSYRAESRPLLGDDVIVGAGAKVLGGLVVANGARIGANAVVLQNVGPGQFAVGVPARLIDKGLERHDD